MGYTIGVNRQIRDVKSIVIPFPGDHGKRENLGEHKVRPYAPAK